MELSRISSKGQVTIPVGIRRVLNLKEGDKVLFIEEAGRVYIANAALIALRQVQPGVEGEVGTSGFAAEEGVNYMGQSIRKEVLENAIFPGEGNQGKGPTTALKKNVRGLLNQYANGNYLPLEQSAWADAVRESNEDR